MEPVANGTLGERCVAWCLEEALQHEHPNAERIRWYHAVAVRNGRPLGITQGNHCVIRVSDDGTQYENIGANEVAGAWNREWTSFEHPRLLGFVEYPGAPVAPADRALADITLSEDAAG